MAGVRTAECAALLPDARSRAPAGSQGGRWGASLRAVGIPALAALIAVCVDRRVITKTQSTHDTTMLAAVKKSCPVPKDFCAGTANRMDTLMYRDCDGDGILDPYCEGGELLRFGYVSSKNGCESTWPNGLCTREGEPDKKLVSTPEHAAPNEITIIHFNDVYEVAGVLEKGRRFGGMSRAAHVVKQERKRNPDRTFVVFAGDLLSPSVLSELFEGAQMVDILNTFNLDAASLGNHEFDFGMDVLQARLQESKFPWLNINLKNEKGELLNNTQRRLIKEVPWTPVWGKTEKATVKVCFFGAAYDVRITMFKDTEFVKYEDIIAASKEEVAHLKEEEKCDVIVPLTHQLAKGDCELSAALGKDVDVILGGHDHSTTYTSVCGPAPFAKGAMNLRSQWVMTLWLGADGKVESVDGRLLSLTDTDPFDMEIHDKVVKWNEDAEKELLKPMGCFSNDLDGVASSVRTGEATMADFFVDAIRDSHKVDVTLINGGSMRGDRIYSKGKVNKKILKEMHTFGNGVVKVYATGEQIKEYINSNLDCLSEPCGDFVQVSGLRYDFDSSKPHGERLVKLMTPDGKEIDAKKQYTVALTDYMFAHSNMAKNELYNMVTVNDAVPIVQSFFEAVERAGDACVGVKLDGRLRDLAK